MRRIDADALTEWMIRELRAMPNGVFNDLNGRQAANLIGKAIDEAPTVGGWISVEDRLPMLIETVLFIGKDYYGKWFGVKRGYFDGSLWHSDDFGTIYSTTPVTHWMPLPEPPKEVSEDG